ncbi:MAG: energy transducer TonB, partial [Bacteroidales bacterium]|nr:energy transducer TonB [Bacteroidales bacterium]
MEIKKSEKASLENKKLLFTEIGLVTALLVTWGAFEYSSKDAQVAVLEDTTQVLVEEEMVAIQNETPPPPPEAPNIPVL